MIPALRFKADRAAEGNRPGQYAGPCLIVTDCDAVYATAKQAGAEMVPDIEDKEYGGRDFTCRDPEGHLWNVGSYDPWSD